jgi:hypothetical protein
LVLIRFVSFVSGTCSTVTIWSTKTTR